MQKIVLRVQGVSVHQGSVLCPLLFLLEALSYEFRLGCPQELLYADDLVLIAGSTEELIEIFKEWKEGMETRTLDKYEEDKNNGD